MLQKGIDQRVLQILSAGRVDGRTFFLPSVQLDRAHYVAVNDVLECLGGHWNRKQKAHVFDVDCANVISDAIESASYTRPKDLGWFPTPAAIASQIVASAGVRPGMRVLEPSAGLGALVLPAIDAGALVTAVEIDTRRAVELNALLANRGQAGVIIGDFLTLQPDAIGSFDAILMNPPFNKRADIGHVHHARRFLRPGGVLVAIMSAGVAFRDDALARSVRDIAASIEPLPDETFRVSGTSVRTVVATIAAT